MLAEINVFALADMSDLEKFYYRQREICLKTPGIDCSEIVENYLDSFKGYALLFLSTRYKTGKGFKVTDSDGEVIDYNYHYAFVQNDKVYDSVLGFCNVRTGEYLNSIKLDGPYTIEKVVGEKYLKSYI